MRNHNRHEMYEDAVTDPAVAVLMRQLRGIQQKMDDGSIGIVDFFRAYDDMATDWQLFVGELVDVSGQIYLPEEAGVVDEPIDATIKPIKMLYDGIDIPEGVNVADDGKDGNVQIMHAFTYRSTGSGAKRRAFSDVDAHLYFPNMASNEHVLAQYTYFFDELDGNTGLLTEQIDEMFVNSTSEFGDALMGIASLDFSSIPPKDEQQQKAITRYLEYMLDIRETPAIVEADVDGPLWLHDDDVNRLYRASLPESILTIMGLFYDSDFSQANPLCARAILSNRSSGQVNLDVLVPLIALKVRRTIEPSTEEL